MIIEKKGIRSDGYFDETQAKAFVFIFSFTVASHFRFGPNKSKSVYVLFRTPVHITVKKETLSFVSKL